MNKEEKEKIILKFNLNENEKILKNINKDLFNDIFNFGNYVSKEKIIQNIDFWIRSCLMTEKYLSLNKRDLELKMNNSKIIYYLYLLKIQIKKSK